MNGTGTETTQQRRIAQPIRVRRLAFTRGIEMTQQFTASKVRNEASNHWRLSDGPQQTLAGKMLHAYADRLEADEKAVPVAYVLKHEKISFKPTVYYGEVETLQRKFGGEIMKLYTHPATADVEPPSSMQEALCVLENAALHGLVLHGDDIPRLRATVDKITPGQIPADAKRLAEALRRTCRKMKTFSRTGALDGAVAVWVDEIESVLAAHSAQAQPPAASVPGVSAQAHENAQAALAAQENPNG